MIKKNNGNSTITQRTVAVSLKFIILITSETNIKNKTIIIFVQNT